MVTDIRPRNQTLVQSQRSRTWVIWFDHLLPPGVKVGADVIAWGKLMTFGNARSFQLVDSVLIKTIKGRAISQGLAEFLKPYIVPPPPRPGTKPDGGNGLA